MPSFRQDFATSFGVGIIAASAVLALMGWLGSAAAEGTGGARIGSAGYNAGTLVGAVGGGPGLSGATAQETNRIRDVLAPPDAPAPAGAPAAPAAPPK